MKGSVLSVAMLACMVGGAVALAGGDAPSVRYGADLRLREEAFDKFPDSPAGENNYFRVRPRVWGEADLMDNVTFRARAVNEFRLWQEPKWSVKHVSADSATYDFPDEWVFDNLYFDIKNLLADRLDLRVGRQEMMYGTGRVILEGTPEDGSRTIHFNAAKATWKGLESRTIDVFGIYNPSEDDLAIHSVDRDLTGLTSANDDMTESGGGIYFTSQLHKSLPFELYAIYKNESDWKSGPVTNVVEHDALDLGTVGFRVMPVFTEILSGSLEAAYQMGERGNEDVEGYMADAVVTVKPAIMKDLKPAIKGGVYYLSGDDRSTTDKDEGWNPLWARYPQTSELYVYLYPRGRWSNLIMPNIGMCMNPVARVKTSASVAYLMAPEKDGLGGGDERGWLGMVKGEFAMGEKIFMDSDKLTGHILLEVLEPGDYYQSTDTAYFARWELLYAF